MKKQITIILFLFSLLLFSCKKNTPENTNENLPTGIEIVKGNFMNGVHRTSGSVKIIRNTNNVNHLVFENFKTDNGPDLYVLLSPSTSGSPYQEIGLLKAVTGNFSYELSPSINFTANNRVLIWCKRFTVLFGHASLQ
jgi:hypothetical protein